MMPLNMLSILVVLLVLAVLTLLLVLAVLLILVVLLVLAIALILVVLLVLTVLLVAHLVHPPFFIVTIIVSHRGAFYDAQNLTEGMHTYAFNSKRHALYHGAGIARAR